MNNLICQSSRCTLLLLHPFKQIINLSTKTVFPSRNPCLSLQLRSLFPPTFLSLSSTFPPFSLSFSHTLFPNPTKENNTNLNPMNSSVSDTQMASPLLYASTTSSSSSRSLSSLSSEAEDIENPQKSNLFELNHLNFKFQSLPFTESFSFRSLAVLSGHVGSVSCLALCGEFILSASQGKDIIVWQQPDLRLFTKFGHGDGSVKALVTFGNKVFTAHQDSRIRVWKVSRRSENVFRLVDTLPTTKDYLGKFMKQSNYVQTRRHHKRLWIEHSDSISCLAICNGFIYSGSWDKTLKVWRISDLKCIESIKAHDDAINGLVACRGMVYSASADGKIKAWGKDDEKSHSLKGILEGHKDVSLNSVIVSEDGKWVYAGGSDGFVMGWEGSGDYLCWKLACETIAHEMAVLSLCLVGEFICSGSADKSIGIWKRQPFGKLCKVGVISGHEGPVKCLQASPSHIGGGFLLYSGSLDKSLRVWWVSKHTKGEEETPSTPSLQQKSTILF